MRPAPCHQQTVQQHTSQATTPTAFLVHSEMGYVASDGRIILFAI